VKEDETCLHLIADITKDRIFPVLLLKKKKAPKKGASKERA
jgi:hypothetical protein